MYMIGRTLHLHSAPTNLKGQLYVAFIRSKLAYCCQLWRPYAIKYIVMLEKVQQRATKFVLNDYNSDYRHRLHKLDLLPLMYWYEIQDLLFLIKCLQNPPDNFNIYDCISFVSSNTRRNQFMLQCNHTRTSRARHFYFNRVVKLWNSIQLQSTILFYQTPPNKHLSSQLR